MPGSRLLVLSLLPVALGACGSVWAQAKPPTGIYTCIDDKGRKLTSDRPIPECSAKEQRILNRDGSLKAVYPPTLTADERAEMEARDRKAVEARAAQADAVRRDRNLTARFPNEETHRKAREAALDTVRLAMRASDQRIKDLAAERKPLLDEAEFHAGKTMPAKLRQALDANDAALEAQRTLVQNQQAEIGRINALFDIELDRLKRLWSGAAPGSMGVLNADAEPAAAPAAASKSPQK